MPCVVADAARFVRSDSEAIAPDSELVVSGDGKMIGAKLPGWIVMMPKEDEILSGTQISYDGGGKNIMIGLEPEQTYNIFDNGVNIGPKVSSENGILDFHTDNTRHSIIIAKTQPVGCEAVGGTCKDQPCSGMSSCTSTVGICTSGYCCTGQCVRCIHEADISPCDGSVSCFELANYMIRWIYGSVSMMDVFEAMVLWKS